MPYVCQNPPSAYPGYDYQKTNYYNLSATYYSSESQTCLNAAANGFGNLISTIQVAKDVYAISRATKAKDGLIRFWGKGLTARTSVLTNTPRLFVWHPFGQYCGSLVPWPYWRHGVCDSLKLRLGAEQTNQASHRKPKADLLSLDGNVDPNDWYFQS